LKDRKKGLGGALQKLIQTFLIKNRNDIKIKEALHLGCEERSQKGGDRIGLLSSRLKREARGRCHGLSEDNSLKLNAFTEGKKKQTQLHGGGARKPDQGGHICIRKNGRRTREMGKNRGISQRGGKKHKLKEESGETSVIFAWDEWKKGKPP